MKIFLSVLFNALILYAIVFFMPSCDSKNLECVGGIIAQGGWQLYLTGGLVLGILNFVVRPLLKIIGFPFMILTLGLFILVINGIILYLLQMIIQSLNIAGIQFEIKGIVNFIIAVAIFTIFNTIYNTFIKK